MTCLHIQEDCMKSFCVSLFHLGRHTFELFRPCNFFFAWLFLGHKFHLYPLLRTGLHWAILKLFVHSHSEGYQPLCTISFESNDLPEASSYYHPTIQHRHICFQFHQYNYVLVWWDQVHIPSVHQLVHMSRCSSNFQAVLEWVL